MAAFFVIGFVIIFIVLLLSVVTTTKAYSYKHTVDPLENNPNIKRSNDKENGREKKGSE